MRRHSCVPHAAVPGQLGLQAVVGQHLGEQVSGDAVPQR
jgi:hypothetical protein